MNLEHIAINVPDAPAAAKWYSENLGMKIVMANDAAPFIHFLADEAGSMIEIYSNTDGDIPDYRKIHPLTLHIAFTTDDLVAERERLVAAGATLEGDVNSMISGTELQFLRDPWGICLQLVKRDKQLI